MSANHHASVAAEDAEGYTGSVIFLPAINWLVAGGMVAAAFFVIVIALLVNPPTAFINKLQDRTKEKD